MWYLNVFVRDNVYACEIERGTFSRKRYKQLMIHRSAFDTFSLSAKEAI